MDIESPITLDPQIDSRLDKETQELIAELKSFGVIEYPDPWLSYESFTLTAAKVKQIETIFELELRGKLESETDEALNFVAMHAWRIIAAKKHLESIPVLIDLLRNSIHNDWLHDEIPKILVQFGLDSIEPIMDSFTKNFIFGSEVYKLAALIESLTTIAKNYPEAKNKIITFLGNLLNDFEVLPPVLNSFIITALGELKAVEYAKLIQTIFEKQFLDEEITDWEWVREEFEDLVDLPEDIEYEEFQQNNLHYNGDEKFQKLLRNLNVPYKVEVVKIQVLGSLLAIERVPPSEIINFIMGADDEFEEIDFQSEGQARYFYQEFLGLWNHMADYQNQYFALPPLFKEKSFSESTLNFLNLIALSDQLMAFINGLEMGNTSARLGPQDSTQFISFLKEKIEVIEDYLETKKYNDNGAAVTHLINEVYHFWKTNYLQFAKDCQEKRNALIERVRFIEKNKGVGRNDPCPCGSGKKFKKCCLMEH